MSAADDKSPEEIEAEIAQTRDELGDTVAELADRADVKKQAKKKVSEAGDQVKEKVEGAKTKATAKVEGITGGADPQGGSGGDIGSGPTGDVRNSPGIVDGGGAVNFGAVGGAFFAGLVIGWVLWH